MTRNTTDKKLYHLRYIEFSNDIELATNLLIKWKNNSENEELNKFTDAFTRIWFFAQNMETEIEDLRFIVKEYRAKKNQAYLDTERAVKRAKKAEKKVAELETQLKLYNTNT